MLRPPQTLFLGERGVQSALATRQLKRRMEGGFMVGCGRESIRVKSFDGIEICKILFNRILCGRRHLFF